MKSAVQLDSFLLWSIRVEVLVFSLLANPLLANPTIPPTLDQRSAKAEQEIRNATSPAEFLEDWSRVRDEAYGLYRSQGTYSPIHPVAWLSKKAVDEVLGSAQSYLNSAILDGTVLLALFQRIPHLWLLAFKFASISSEPDCTATDSDQWLHEDLRLSPLIDRRMLKFFLREAEKIDEAFAEASTVSYWLDRAESPTAVQTRINP